MKEHFNKKTHIRLKKTDGTEIELPKADIIGLLPDEDFPDGPATKIYFQDSSSYFGQDIRVHGSIDEIVDMLNGEPSSERQRQWQEDIIRDRQAAASEEIRVKGETHTRAKMEINERSSAHISDVEQRLRSGKRQIDDTMRTIEGSLALKLSLRLRSAAEGRGHTLLGKGLWIAAATLSVRRSDIFGVLKEQNDLAQRLERQRAASITERDRELAEKERIARSGLDRLRLQQSDPNMRPEDRAVLHKKIADFRVENGAPEFQFTRVWGREAVERDRAENKRQNRTHGEANRGRFDFIKEQARVERESGDRDHSPGRGRGRFRSRSRTRDFGMER